MTIVQRLVRHLLRKSSVKPLRTTTYAATTSAVAESIADMAIEQYVASETNPFRLIQLRESGESAKKAIDDRLSNITQLLVRRSNISGDIDFSASNPETTFDNAIWYKHPLGFKIVARFVGDKRVELLVDTHWSSKDVFALKKTIDAFRQSVVFVELDSAVAELIIASLSLIDLDRWYAFLCYMKAVNNPGMHFLVTDETSGVTDRYFPGAQEITIRTSRADTAHLARINDYGVRSQFVVNRQRLTAMRVIVTDASPDTTCKDLLRNLYYFRSWASAGGFDDRYQQLIVGCV